MATSETTRLKITRWSDDSDNFTRLQMDDSHAALEEVVAIFTEDTDFPSGGGTDQYARSFHLDTDTNILYYSYNNGANWRPLNEFAAPTTTLTPGGSNSTGSAVSISRSDHAHALPGWGTSTQAVSTSATAGSAGTFARSDHVHVIGTGAINASAQFANQVVSTAAIGDSQVTTQKIGDGQVTRDKIIASQRIPVGAVMPFAGSAAPTGWAICDGSLKLPSDPDWANFSALFGVIGTTYGGSGGGFNLPNLANRVPQGVGSTSLGATGGGTATLATNNLPAHSHPAGFLNVGGSGSHNHAIPGQTISGGGHDHTISSSTHSHGYGGRKIFYRDDSSPFFVSVVGDPGPFGTNLRFRENDAFDTVSIFPDISANTGDHQHLVFPTSTTGGDHQHTVTGTTGNTGTGSAFNVNTAHVGMNYIIKL